MTDTAPLPFDAPLQEYQRQAEALFSALQAGEDAAGWRFKWQHPRFRGRTLTDVREANLDLADARRVIAREHAFDSWDDLATFAQAVSSDGPVWRFETAADAVVSGDLATLRTILHDDPALVHARSTRRHHATLLHYLGANGVEDTRQRTPHDAVEVARLLLDHGAEVDALADLYDERCTTLSMVVSSGHPARAGLQVALAETLLDHGASRDGSGTAWQSALLTALTFGYLDTAQALARREPSREDLAVAAGLGRLGDTARLLPAASPEQCHRALALAAQHGHADVVRALLDASEDPDRFNPPGFHAHSTPLHQAALAGHDTVVRLLVERGARLDTRDTIYRGTPLDWAVYNGQETTARLLREAAASRG